MMARARPSILIPCNNRIVADSALGLYISIPFCRSKCTYCNFASGVYPAADHARYIDRVTHDLACACAWTAQTGARLPRQVDTIYLGGGTPSLLASDLVTRLFAAIRNHFDLLPDAEITVECAPGQLPDATLQAMAAAGVNRVSLGVQSFIDREAALSGRLHNRAIVLDDLARLRDAGIRNLNLDLIAGLAGQTLASWQESVDTLIAARVPHASIYMLEVDEDSRLGREMLLGGVRYHAEAVPTDDTIARMYESAIEKFAAAGLAQYEISNFARPGFASRHNLRYWLRRPYLGLGLDASSALRAAESGAGNAAAKSLLRFTTTSDLKAYLAAPSQPDLEWLSPARELEEAWFLGLRMNSGVSLRAIADAFGADAASTAGPIVDRLVEDGLVTVAGEAVRLTPRGRLLSNEVFAQFIGLSAVLSPV